MVNNLMGMAIAAQIRTNTAYEDAIEARSHFETMRMSVPVSSPELYKQVSDAEELAVNTINAAWKAKDAAERLLAEIEKNY